MSDQNQSDLDRAAQAIAQAEAIVIGAGAGMGVDSGLPDFRGNQGFWNAYPPYQTLGLGFTELANPRWFVRDPALAWGFYGHRLHLYRKTIPHAGFSILRKWINASPLGGFVYTSNVDGQFQRAGFDPARIVECHGAIGRLQCMTNCGFGTFSAELIDVDVNEATMKANEPLPTCPQCGSLARPNILMFSDWDFDDEAVRTQIDEFHAWLSGARDARLVVVECGAGTAISTVRSQAEMLVRISGGTLVRINLREPEVDFRGIGLSMGALEALQSLDSRVEKLRESADRS